MKETNHNLNAEAFENQKVVPVHMEKELQKSFIEYAMSVIVSRALPDVRDGLKPVHRRIARHERAALHLPRDRRDRNRRKGVELHRCSCADPNVTVAVVGEAGMENGPDCSYYICIIMWPSTLLLVTRAFWCPCL